MLTGSFFLKGGTMKRIICASFCCALLSSVCCACSSGDSSVASSGTSVPATAASAASETSAVTTEGKSGYSGGDITGEWIYTGLSGRDVLTLDFEPDGIASALVDASSMIYFEEDGSLNAMGITIPAENISYDGSEIRVSMKFGKSSGDGDPEKQNKGAALTDMLVMERIGDPAPDNMDGEYSISGGTLYDTIISPIMDGMGAEDAETTAVIDGDSFYLDLNRALSYTTEGEKLTIEGGDMLLSVLDISYDDTLYYTVSGDELLLGTGDEYELTLRRSGK